MHCGFTDVTPEYARTVKQQYPNATLDELVQLRIFHIDDAFLAAAKRHGFTSLSIQKLVQLRISGVLGDVGHGGEMTKTGWVVLICIPGSIHRLVSAGGGASSNAYGIVQHRCHCE